MKDDAGGGLIQGELFDEVQSTDLTIESGPEKKRISKYTKTSASCVFFVPLNRLVTFAKLLPDIQLIGLVLSRGTHRDHITTSWSAEACKIRLEMSGRTAARGIEVLISIGELEKSGPRRRPLHKFKKYKTRHDICFSNQLVDAPERPLVELRREKSTELNVAFWISHYFNELGHHGGVSPEFVWRSVEYETLELENGWRCLAISKLSKIILGEDIYHPLSPLSDFGDLRLSPDHFARLEELGLIDWTLHVADKDGSIIPIGSLSGTSAEDEEEAIGNEMQIVAEKLIPDRHLKSLTKKFGGNPKLVLVPPDRRLADVIAIARLGYLPETEPTQEWRGELKFERQKWSHKLSELARSYSK